MSTRLGTHARVLRDEMITIHGLVVVGLQWHGFPDVFTDWEGVMPSNAPQVDVLIVHQPPGNGSGQSLQLKVRYYQVHLFFFETITRYRFTVVVD
jgi:hypothetical protein